MKSRYVFMSIVTAAMLSLILIGLTNTYAQNDKFRAKLDGNNEVPPVDTPAEGVINFKTNSEGLFTWKMNLTGLTDATGASIYQGAPTENGQPIVDLFKSGKHQDTVTGMVLRGSITDSTLQGAMEGKTLEDLKSAMGSGNTYVKIATAEHPDGMIRGQIKIKGADDAAAAAFMNITDTTSAQ